MTGDSGVRWKSEVGNWVGGMAGFWKGGEVHKWIWWGGSNEVCGVKEKRKKGQGGPKCTDGR
jgi:hypothetical protein